MPELKLHRFFSTVKKQWREIEKDAAQAPYQSLFMASAVSKRMPFYMVKNQVIPTYCEILEDGKTVMIAQLWQKINKNNQGGKQFINFQMTGFNIYDFVYRQSVSTEEMKQYIRLIIEKLDITELVLMELPSESKVYKALSEMQLEGYSKKESVRESVNIDVGVSYEEYYHSLSKHTRQNIRTAYNRLSNDNMTYELKCTRGKKLDRKALNDIIDVYLKRRQERYSLSSSILKSAYMKYIDFPTYYQQNWKDNMYSVLYINGKIAAFLSGITCSDGERVIVPRLAINSDFEKYSPGMILINETAKKFIEDFKIRNLDLSKGKEPYKLAMGGEVYCGHHIILTKE